MPDWATRFPRLFAPDYCAWADTHIQISLQRPAEDLVSHTAGSAMNGAAAACAEQVHGRLKKRLFLYGPAHRAQMLAETQGRRVLALGKVGAELYLAA